MTGTAHQMDEYFDIGPERATQPPETDTSDRELDALREKWVAEAREDMDALHVSRRMMEDADYHSTIVVIATHVMQGDMDAARVMAETVIEREVERREREYFR